MAYKIEYASSVEKDLRKVPQDVALKAISLVREKIAPNPHIGVPLKGKYRELRKFRFGTYRIIYSIIKDRITIYVLRIRHRKDVYLGL